MAKNLICLFLILFPVKNCFSQLTDSEKELIAPSLSVSPEIDFLLEIHLHGTSSTGNKLPFWLYNNQRGRISETTNFSTWVTAKSVLFLTDDTFLLTGTSILYQDGIEEGVIPDELFVHFQDSHFYATVGRKQRADQYLGLSATNENILWSLNSRPLPGLQLGTSAPLFLFGTGGPGLEFSWNEYLLGKNRKIKDATLHHKSFHLNYKIEGLGIKVGAQHFAHWGGNKADGTPLPEGSDDYWRAITLKENLHTHMTTYEAFIEYEFDNFDIQFLYNHFSTDRSGRLLENIPDGRYGIFFTQENPDHFVNAIMYEFFYTKNQSRNSESQFVDNYFNFYQYAEGWAYNHHFMGVPFFTYDLNSQRITGNKFLAHHIGIGGQLNIPFQTNPYRLLLSYVRNSGTFTNPLIPSENKLYSFFEMGLFKEPLQIDLQFSSEATTSSAPLLGFGLLLKYRFQ